MCNVNLLAYNDFNINVESTYSVQAYGIHADFSLGTRVFQEIEEALQGYEIGILGIVHSYSTMVEYTQPTCYQFSLRFCDVDSYV